jgi:hypothetical protein
MGKDDGRGKEKINCKEKEKVAFLIPFQNKINQKKVLVVYY